MANTAISKIGKRASQIYNKAGNTRSYQACTKIASAEYRSGKLGAKPKKKAAKKSKPVKKTKYRQTGTSSKHYDEMREARAPGARIPRGGKKVTYYERRKNRSDVPGRLTGTAHNEMILRNLRERNTSLAAGEQRLKMLQRTLKEKKDKTEKNGIRRLIKDERKYISVVKREIRMLRILIK